MRDVLALALSSKSVWFERLKRALPTTCEKGHPLDEASASKQMLTVILAVGSLQKLLPAMPRIPQEFFTADYAIYTRETGYQYLLRNYYAYIPAAVGLYPEYCEYQLHIHFPGRLKLLLNTHLPLAKTMLNSFSLNEYEVRLQLAGRIDLLELLEQNQQNPTSAATKIEIFRNILQRSRIREQNINSYVKHLSDSLQRHRPCQFQFFEMPSQQPCYPELFDGVSIDERRVLTMRLSLQSETPPVKHHFAYNAATRMWEMLKLPDRRAVPSATALETAFLGMRISNTNVVPVV